MKPASGFNFTKKGLLKAAATIGAAGIGWYRNQASKKSKE
jgi:hypothetical protein